MPDFKVSITICSWNTKEDLDKCLASIEAVRDEGPFDVIVFDNNSADGSPDMVMDKFPWVHLIRSSRNFGFTGGQNLALSNRQSGDALLLNSDEAAVGRLLADRHALVSLSDAGAHLTFFNDAGFGLHLLGKAASAESGVTLM